MLKFIFASLLFLCCCFLYAEDEPLTLDFTEAPVADILNTIAEISGHNLVLGNNITGTMSLHVAKMNWPAALQLVLSKENLTLKNLDEHTWYIGDSATLLNQVRAQTEMSKSVSDALPLQTEFFHIRYGNPSDILSIVQGNHALLSARGQASLDQRTATLIVSDIPSSLDLVKTLLLKIDVPVKEIEINARIVVVNKSALSALGVLLGNNSQMNLTNLLGSVNSATIHLPIENPAGSLGFSLGKIAGQELDLQLQAMEAMGDGKVISAPELTVSDNHEAYIEQGSEVPFRTSTSSGATQIEFKKAVLGLKVTPQIMSDGSVNLKLQINKDSVTNQEGVNNTPIIATSEVNTNVRVADGETLVLGGIYSENKSTQVNQVPLLSGIPGLGWLFKSKNIVDQYTDLLVFITPKILVET